MSAKEIAGLVLLAAAFVIAPFGYWLSFKWYLVALVVFITGIFLFVTARVAKKLHAIDDLGATDVYPTKELKGFNGADLFDGEDD